MLNLNDLSAGQPGLTPESGGSMAQCAAVCLELQGHTSGTELGVRGYIANNHILEWPPVTGQIRRAWADIREATEKGAEGIAILLIEQEVGYAAIERAAIGTHIDRWLGEESDAPTFSARQGWKYPVSSRVAMDKSGEDRVKKWTESIPKGDCPLMSSSLSLVAHLPR